MKDFTSVAELRAHYAQLKRRIDPPPSKKRLSAPEIIIPPVVEVVIKPFIQPVLVEKPEPECTLTTEEKIMCALVRLNNAGFKNLKVTSRIVCDVWGVTMSDLFGKTRRTAALEPRQIAMSICRHMLHMSYAEIGRKFYRDHSTVINAVNRISDVFFPVFLKFKRLGEEIGPPPMDIVAESQRVESLNDIVESAR